MGTFARLRVTSVVIFAVAMVALIYAEAGTLLIDMGTGDGDFTGPFSEVISSVESLVPLVLAFILLGIVTWLVVSSVREERTVDQRRPGP